MYMKRSLFSLILTAIMALGLWQEAGAAKFVGAKSDKSGQADKSLSAGCANPQASAVLDLNNVRTTIWSGGDMWWDLKQVAKYQIPKDGNTAHALYVGTLWIGGTDVNGQLKIAAQRYRANGPDFYTGPLNRSGANQGEVDAATCKEYDRIWKITRAQVQLHNLCMNVNPADALCEGYQIPQDILEWPAFEQYPNDPSLSGGLPSVQFIHAPFIDVDNSGDYNAAAGDYPGYDLFNQIDCSKDRTPFLYGDMTLYWIFNDKGSTHYETGVTVANTIGMEVRAQAFAFATNDEINNMTFYNYELINRGTSELFNCYFGVNTDADLGCGFDDYAGCDVTRGFGYVYNSDPNDATCGTSIGYGLNPPAIGIDFFEGPYQDANLYDDSLVVGDVNTYLAINGVGYGDGFVDNERIGMRRFLYYKNELSGVQNDPDQGIQYYNYLRGFWTNGVRMTFGAYGYPDAAQCGYSNTASDFMFPGDSDPMHWGTGGQNMGYEWRMESPGPGCAALAAADFRFVQSAGPFRLRAGAVNDITTGAVWARSFSGNPFESVQLVRKADDKAQSLFENCFRVLDGPDAPNVTVQEMDRELILYWTNSILSNNKKNDYSELDYSIVDTSLTAEQKTYKFEGYLVYQVKDASVTAESRHDLSKAQLIAQCDIRNFDATGQPITTLINYNVDQELGLTVPQVEVTGSNTGIFQSLRITEDAFATGSDKRLVNHKRYYFMVLAYGFNRYKKYGPEGGQMTGQTREFIAGRKSATGSIQVYSAIPHISAPESNGTIVNSVYGDTPEITRIEGQGNGGNELELTEQSELEIVASPYTAQKITYKRGGGPARIKVVDPLSIEKGTYLLKFDVPSTSADGATLPRLISNQSRWTLLDKATMDTVAVSDTSIAFLSEQLVFNRNTGKFLGLSISIRQTANPGNDVEENNGVLGAGITAVTSNASNFYIGFLPDADGSSFMNWILSGTSDATQAGGLGDFPFDKSQSFERLSLGGGGALAPYNLSSYGVNGPSYKSPTVPFNRLNDLASVDIVLTADKTKWTRVPVLEADSSACNNTDRSYAHPDLAAKCASKLDLRRSPSVDKNGRYATNDGTLTGSLITSNSNNEEDANYISNYGMGWFPGYAINVETGERLNMAFAEASNLPYANGRDMLFNPLEVDIRNINTDFSAIVNEFGDAILGGKHFLYVFGANGAVPGLNTYPPTPRYDAGQFAMSFLKKLDDVGSGGYTQSTYNTDKGKVFRSAMWTGIPLTIKGTQWLAQDIRIRLRVSKPYAQFLNYANDASPGAINNDYPLYEFSLDDLAPTTGDRNTASAVLDIINVVPNPYYAYSAYETNKLDNRIKVTNLPPTCTVTIYNTAGSLIRRYTKDDNSITSLDWDLKNSANVPVASGIYIIHVNVPGVGSKILKWFGVMRPTDVSNF